MPEIPTEILDAFFTEVEALVSAATPVGELGQAGLYSEEDERFIRREVSRLTYEPQLPHGGLHERRMVERFWRLANNRDWSGGRSARQAAEKWHEIDGYYYQRRPLMMKRDEEEFLSYTLLRNTAHAHRLWEQKWFAEEMLKGLPERVANFRLECKFLLLNVDGTIDRLVRLRNVLGERTKLVALDAEAFSTPSKFRIWLNNKGGYVWEAGEREMNKLQLDVSHESAWRQVSQIVSCGWHPLGGRMDPDATGFSPLRGMWFFGDCAFGPRGELLRADEFGIYWHEQQGYMLDEAGREASFFQRKPMMYPRLEYGQRTEPTEQTERAGGTPTPLTEEEALRPFFADICVKLYESLGGFEAMVMLGSILSYAAGPEVYAQHSCFPGLWVHGEAGSGKSTTVDWLMRFWGFNLGRGLDMIKNISAVGMQIAGEQYSNLPVWLDEYRNAEVEDVKLAILRTSYMRGSQAKWSADGIQRELKTAFVVSGESTSSDAATRGRFPHIQVAATRRRVNHLDWFRQNVERFFFLGRYLMRNRPEYARRCVAAIDEWRHSPETAGISERDKLVHGVAYAGFVAIAQMIGSHSDIDLSLLRDFIIRYSRSASADVKSELNINIWWEDLIVAFNAGELDSNNFRVEAVQMQETAPGSPNQRRWVTYHLFFNPKAVMAQMSIYLAKQHSRTVLKSKDLRDQMSKQSYWLPGNYYKRLGAGRETNYCWGVNLDLHPMGYRESTDEAFASFMTDETSGDPRKGALFAIVHKLAAEGAN